MFDNISVADKLPINDEMVKLGLDKNVFVYQTKDLDRALDDYFIQSGRLLKKKYKTTRWVDEPESFSGGYIEREEPYIEDMNYHGLMRFYHSESVDNLDCWIEYVAKFTNGNLENIELKEFRVLDNTESKKRIKEIIAKSHKNHNKFYNKYFFHTKMWRKIRGILFDLLQSVELFIGRIRMNLP